MQVSKWLTSRHSCESSIVGNLATQQLLDQTG